MDMSARMLFSTESCIFENRNSGSNSPATSAMYRWKTRGRYWQSRGTAKTCSHLPSFHANEGPSWQWAEEGKLAIRPKSAGRGIMVSDFITEHNGYLSLTDDEYQQAIPKHSKECSYSL